MMASDLRSMAVRLGHTSVAKPEATEGEGGCRITRKEGKEAAVGRDGTGQGREGRWGELKAAN